MFNMLNIRPPMGTSHFQQKTGNPPCCVLSPGLPHLSVSGPPGNSLCITVVCWASCRDRKRRGDVLMNVQNTSSFPPQHSTGRKPALLRARNETQVHTVGKVTQLELGRGSKINVVNLCLKFCNNNFLFDWILQ